MQASIPEPEFLLKATPPRAPRATIRREHLHRAWLEARQQPLSLLIAPDGSGKSTAMLQWRRLWLEQGALVAWLTTDCRDRPARFRVALAHALQHASGRTRSDALASRHAAKPDWQGEGLTRLLAAIARVRSVVVLMLDACELLPAETVSGSLAYLIHNAPPNLHLVLASAEPLAWDTTIDPTPAAYRVGIDDLLLQPSESGAILLRRLRDRIDAEEVLRLHEACAGWPMGLQLAASAIEQGMEHSPRAVEAVVWLRGPPHTRYLEALLERLPGDLLGFLSRVAILDHMNAELCEAVVGEGRTKALLARAMLDTALFVVGQSKDWGCLHPLARGALLARFARLPDAERRALHRRASAWYARQGRHADAARHAVAAGDAAMARTQFAQLLWRLKADGRLLEAREELGRIPEAELAQDVPLRVACDWILACTERNSQALADIRPLLANPALDAATGFAAALAASSAAGYGDRLGLIPGLLARWPEDATIIDASGYAVAYINCTSAWLLHTGKTERLRELQPRLSPTGYRHSPALGPAVGRLMIALSHLWDGYPDRAEAVLRPALAHAEMVEGRRSAMAGMFGAVMAAACLDRNQPDHAMAMLAGRLDVILATAIPDVIACAWRTMALCALQQGDPDQALRILAELHGHAVARRWPRLQLHALVERIRIHALAGQRTQVDALDAELEALAAAFADSASAVFRPHYDLLSAIARSYALLERGELEAVERHLLTAHALASDLGRGRELLVVQVLRAVVARQRGAPLALRLLREALSQGKLGGIRRLLLDSHPLAMEMALELRATAKAERKGLPRAAAGAEAGDVARGGAGVAGLLTAREARILGLLHEGVPEPAIATALELTPAVLEWHLGHLRRKFAAANQRILVDRARLLGMVTSHTAALAAAQA